MSTSSSLRKLCIENSSFKTTKVYDGKESLTSNNETNKACNCIRVKEPLIWVPYHHLKKLSSQQQKQQQKNKLLDLYYPFRKAHETNCDSLVPVPTNLLEQNSDLTDEKIVIYQKILSMAIKNNKSSNSLHSEFENSKKTKQQKANQLKQSVETKKNSSSVKNLNRYELKQKARHLAPLAVVASISPALRQSINNKVTSETQKINDTKTNFFELTEEDEDDEINEFDPIFEPPKVFFTIKENSAEKKSVQENTEPIVNI